MRKPECDPSQFTPTMGDPSDIRNRREIKDRAWRNQDTILLPNLRWRADGPEKRIGVDTESRLEPSPANVDSIHHDQDQPSVSLSH